MELSEHVRIFPVILAGGASSRLWPASNRKRPKWDLRLFGGQSLLEQAWERARAVAPALDCFVVAGIAQAALVRRSLPELPKCNLLVEPLPRDTAGAIALSAAAILGTLGNQELQSGAKAPHPKTGGPKNIMLVLPGDHIIRPLSRFRECVAAGALTAAQRNAFVTFGIVPRKPATGYGYIHCGTEIEDRKPESANLPRVFQALGFREKPDLQTAAGYVASGKYYWNGGIFLWTLEALLAEFARQLPGHRALIGAFNGVAPGGRKWAGLLRALFPALQKISIDFGIMEHAQNIAAVVADFEWDDIGSWSAVGEHLERGSGNACAPGAELFSAGARGNVVFAPGKRVALVGVEGLAVVASGGDVLVCRLDRDQDVKQACEVFGAAGKQRPT